MAKGLLPYFTGLVPAISSDADAERLLSIEATAEAEPEIRNGKLAVMLATLDAPISVKSEAAIGTSSDAGIFEAKEATMLASVEAGNLANTDAGRAAIVDARNVITDVIGDAVFAAADTNDATSDALRFTNADASLVAMSFPFHNK
jgi:hypothetical protein